MARIERSFDEGTPVDFFGLKVRVPTSIETKIGKFLRLPQITWLDVVTNLPRWGSPMGNRDGFGLVIQLFLKERIDIGNSPAFKELLIALDDALGEPTVETPPNNAHAQEIIIKFPSSVLNVNHATEAEDRHKIAVSICLQF